MAKYLTQEWLDQSRALAAGQRERPGASVRLNHVVTGGPGGEVQYHWVLDNGRLLEGRLGLLEDGEVTMTTAWADSVRIAKGELDLNAAFMQGKVKVTGNLAKLMALLPLTGDPEYQELQARIREVTEY